MDVRVMLFTRQLHFWLHKTYENTQKCKLLFTSDSHNEQFDMFKK